jgi:hypothetical protein
MFLILPIRQQFHRPASFDARAPTWAKAQQNPHTLSPVQPSLGWSRGNPNPISPSIPISTAPWIPKSAAAPARDVAGRGRRRWQATVPLTFLPPPFSSRDPGRAHLSSRSILLLNTIIQFARPRVVPHSAAPPLR